MSHRRVTVTHNGVFPFIDTFRYGKILNDTTAVLSNDINFGNIKFTTDQGTYTEVTRCSKCGDKRGKLREILLDGEIDQICICDACYKTMYQTCVQCSKTYPERKIAIKAEMTQYHRAYCRKCAVSMHTALKFNDCTCGACTESKQYYKNLFAELNVSDDFVFTAKKSHK